MLELKHISSGYDHRNTIFDISLRFETGKTYTIVGKNGCGKSTLLKTCAGLLEADTGGILLDGREFNMYTPTERACLISYLSQSRKAPAISVERLVEHGRYPRLASPRKLNGHDHNIVEASLQRMQVSHLRKKKLNELSGGEQQRVYVAMLLAQDTPVLLLDEPTTYMDVEHQLAFLDLLQGLKQEGKCIIMVLHDLSHAMKNSDTIIAMENGRVVHASSPEAMLSQGTLEKIFQVKIEAVGNPVQGYILKR